ncbi:MAG: hypothetical protein KA387_07480 [Rubrivivax sp.]|nr:hypothetical protein [Rubrivivax sp.]
MDQDPGQAQHVIVIAGRLQLQGEPATAPAATSAVAPQGDEGMHARGAGHRGCSLRAWWHALAGSGLNDFRIPARRRQQAD